MGVSKSSKKKIIIINGPNLNMLGIRNPQIYGSLTLKELNHYINYECRKLNLALEFFQSNHEGEIIDKIHSCYKKIDGIIINAGGLTHTSICLRDAIESVGIPTIEVHLSDIKRREEFRKKTYLKDVCNKSISGFGKKSYTMAIEHLVKHF